MILTIDPPGNMTISKSVVYVNEGNIPEKVFCHAEGRPQPTFEWRYTGTTSNGVEAADSSQSSSEQMFLANGGNSGNIGGSSGSSSGQNNNQPLVLNSAVGRQQAGFYTCIARNAHGNSTSQTYLDVMCKSKVRQCIRLYT